MSANSPLDSSPRYLWQDRYEAAVIETDSKLLPKRIEKAREAMQKRLRSLKPKNSHFARAEYEAIRNAEDLLRAIEKLK